MSIPSLPGFTFRKKATSADQQAQDDAISWLIYKAYGTYGQTGSAQSLANDTDVAVAWNANIRANKVVHSTVTNNDQITPSEPGLYLVTATVAFAGSGTGYRKVWGQLNGSSANEEGSTIQSSVGSSVTSLSWSQQLFFNGSTDYLRIMVRQTSGSSMFLAFDNFNPRVSLMWLSGLV